MRYYNSKASRLRYAAPHTLVGVGGAASAVLGLLLFLTGWVVSLVPANYFIRPATLAGIVRNLFEMGASLVFPASCSWHRTSCINLCPITRRYATWSIAACAARPMAIRST